MKPFFGYIRVSTPKQGHGVSLIEQRDAILRHAGKSSLEIVRWFEEQETAAKRGRPVFNEMLKLLRQGKAQGVVLHKIDRGARNLKDWADLGELIDSGIELHFANEGLDLHSRGGRLSADIQAVVAADFIRNLREETRKGFYGRLKQGIYPLGAPMGYVNKGGGKVKELDPVNAPLVRKAFELYATCRYSLDTLGEELYQSGLRNRLGRRFARGGLAKLLKNPFYMGIIQLRSSGEAFPGAHAPLIPKSLFTRVQLVLSGKANTRVHKHDFLFRRLLRCKECGQSLVGERQKGHSYYRCHSPSCSTTGIRQEAVEDAIQRELALLRFDDNECRYFRSKLTEMEDSWGNRKEEELAAGKLHLDQLAARLNRLTDALLDGTVDRSMFEQRKAALLTEQKGVEEKRAQLRGDNRMLPARLANFLELAGNAWLSYRLANPEEKREFLKITTSNRELDRKNVVVKLSFPFCEVAKRNDVSLCGLDRTIPRTWDQLLDTLLNWFTANPQAFILPSFLR